MRLSWPYFQQLYVSIKHVTDAKLVLEFEYKIRTDMLLQKTFLGVASWWAITQVHHILLLTPTSTSIVTSAELRPYKI